MKKQIRGFTLVEMLITGAIAVIILAAFVNYLPQIQTYFRRVQLQQQLRSDSSTAMDTMNRFLRNGKASSVTICSCNNASCASGGCVPSVAIPPNSQIVFQTQDGIWHQFLWSANKLLMADGANSTTFTSPRTLASNVSSVMFSGDYRDFSILNVNLFFSVPLDSTGDPSRVSTLVLPTQSVRMVATQ